MPELIDELFCDDRQKIRNYSIDRVKFSGYTTARMANTKSAIKRIRRIARQTAVNKSRKSKFRNAIKKINFLIESKKKKRSFEILT